MGKKKPRLPGESVRKGAPPEKLAEIRSELDKHLYSFPTNECITPEDLRDLIDGRIPERYNAKDILELLAHITDCSFCGPMCRTQLPKTVAKFLKNKKSSQMLRELSDYFNK